MAQPATIVLKRDMGSSHAEFFRILPNALGDNQYIQKQSSIDVSIPPGKVLITLGAEQCRNIANIRIPHTEVSLAFSNLEQRQIDDFIERFDRYYHRGGG